MSYKKHPRHITDQQFSDGTTIDGSRIDDAMRDVVEHVNNVPKGDLGRRFVQTQYVAGWQPVSPLNTPITIPNTTVPSFTHRMPWLPSINWPATGTINNTNKLGGSVVGSIPAENAASAIKNRHRFKGTNLGFGAEIDITSSDSAAWISGVQWAWSRRFAFTDPAILHDISIHLHADKTVEGQEPYGNTFRQSPQTGSAGSPTPGYAAGDASRDLIVLVDVAHPYTPEDTRMRSVVFLARDFGVTDSAFSRQPMGLLSSSAPTYTDMAPTFRGGPSNDSTETVGGILHRAHDLNIPLPAKSRVRLAVLIPQYKDDEVKSSWGIPSGREEGGLYLQPWSSQSYSAALTVLEEVSGGKD